MMKNHLKNHLKIFQGNLFTLKSRSSQNNSFEINVQTIQC